MSDTELLDYDAFRIECEQNGHYLFSYIRNGTVQDLAREMVYHFLSAKVAPKQLFATSKGGPRDYTNVARYSRKEWHELLVEALLRVFPEVHTEART